MSERTSRWWLAAPVAVGLCCGPSMAQQARPSELPGTDAPLNPPRSVEGAREGARGAAAGGETKVRPVPPPPASILIPETKPILLETALKLAGVDNPEILLAQQRVVEAVALRQRAAVVFIPNLNVGLNFDSHVGNLQQSSGNILKVNRSALYAGLGANAIAAGTVNIPGLQIVGNVSEGIFANLVARQLVRQREFESLAVRNDTLLQVASAYVALVTAEGRRALAIQTREDTRRVAEVTRNYARTGQGRPADADRALAELAQRDQDILQAENEVMLAAARLAQLLNLDPSVRLFAVDGWAVPRPIVPEPIPLCQLIFIAMNQRPELAAQQAAIRQAFLALQGAKVLPFSPNIILGYSSGTFGGGSNLVAQPGGFNTGTQVFKEPRFDTFRGREDVDVVLWWTAQNLGLGNLALINIARSQYNIAGLQSVVILNRVRAEVASAYARVHARFAQIGVAEQALEASAEAFKEDFRRQRGGEALPIEVLDSLRLLGQSRFEYLQSIMDYNRAQFELYVALGQPPAHYLSRPIPSNLVAPPPNPGLGPGNPVPPGGSGCPAPVPGSLPAVLAAPPTDPASKESPEPSKKSGSKAP